MTSPLAQSLAIAQIARAEREGRAVLVETKLMVKCVSAHDRCDGGPCDYCEPVTPLRGENGRFAGIKGAAQ